jgi:hypothetical protein
MTQSDLGAKAKLIRTLWGVTFTEPSQWRSFFRSVRESGFSGIECCSPGPFFPFAADPELFRSLLSEFQLDLVLQVHTLEYPVISGNVDLHIDSLQRKVREAAAFNPVLINCHAGKDSFSIADVVKVIDATRQLELEIGGKIPILHETHRQRMLYSPFVLRSLLREAPEAAKALKINADLSHFAVVLERLPSAESDAEFWPEVLEFIAENGYYIHARVGGAQRIQVADPQDPGVAAEVAAHMSWWRRIASSVVGRGLPLRVCPEFGPVPYLPVEPFTQRPLADLETVVLSFGSYLTKNL